MSTNILMPALSPTMEEGKLAKWHVKEGDAVKAGDILAEIETDKATMEFEAIDEGRIGKILVPEGAEGVKVNAPIAVLLGEGEDANAPAPKAAAVKSEPPKAAAPKQAPAAPPLPVPAKAQPVPAPAPAQTAARPSANGHSARIFASPLAKRIAQMSGVDLAGVQGSGPRGRIVKSDVEAAKQKGPSPMMGEGGPKDRKGVEQQSAIAGITPLPDARLFYKQGDYEEVPHDSMRRTIARRLTSAKSLVP